MQEETTRDRSNLMNQIKEAINSGSWENEANVPDFVLAEFLIRCFNAFNDMVKKRDKWYSVHLEPCNSHFEKQDAPQDTVEQNGHIAQQIK